MEVLVPFFLSALGGGTFLGVRGEFLGVRGVYLHSFALKDGNFATSHSLCTQFSTPNYTSTKHRIAR